MANQRNRDKPADPREREPKPPFPPQSQPHPGFESRMEPEPDYGAETYRGHGRLAGKTALITGGDSGIGRAVAVAFAKEGADVAIGYLEEDEDARTTQRVVENCGRRCFLLRGDLADADRCRSIVEDAARNLGRIDILVNNAAFQGQKVERFEQLDDERIDYTFRTNIIAMFVLVRASLPHMKPGSSIINTTSIQAYHPSPGILDYAVTKGAIVTFTKGLSHSLADRGIRVNAVAPGPVWTPIIPQSFSGEKVERFGADTPLGRAGQPVELSPAFVFLASEEASYVTGETLAVTGGRISA